MINKWVIYQLQKINDSSNEIYFAIKEWRKGNHFLKIKKILLKYMSEDEIKDL